MKHPNDAETAFLDLAYNRFLDLYQEIISDIFWKNDSKIRFHRVKEIFFVYDEIIQYKPLQHILENVKINNVGQTHLQNQFFRFIRNIFAHFSFFDVYDDVWITKQISTWNNKSKFIHKFLISYMGHEPIKYRIWDKRNKVMTYLNIQFPIIENETSKIYLYEFTKEKEGILFSIDCMWKLLSTQIESIKQTE